MMVEKKSRRASKDYPQEFETFYAAFPRHSHKFAALKAYKTQVNKGYSHDELLAGARAFAQLCKLRGTDLVFIPHPASWLLAGRWLDDELKPFGAVAAVPCAPVQTATGYGAILQRKLGDALFSAWFGECEFTAHAVVAPTKTRRDMIVNKFQYRFPELVVEVRT